jgi:hypothetical protein
MKAEIQENGHSFSRNTILLPILPFVQRFLATFKHAGEKNRKGN